VLSKGQVFRKRVTEYRKSKGESNGMKFSHKDKDIFTFEQKKDMKVRGKQELSNLSRDLIAQQKFFKHHSREIMSNVAN
jgi:hypothetical protein